jgi:hypothetical protein
VLRRLLPVLALLLIFWAPARAADRWWFGGGLALAFGDVDYVSLQPILGYKVTPKFGVGGRLIFTYRDDGRFDPSVTSTDYGAGLFARYFVTGPVFVQGEYEHISYEYPQANGSTTRDGYDSWLGGVGFAKPISRNASFFVLGLYNFSYDDDEPSPYNDAFVLRVGVGVGF